MITPGRLNDVHSFDDLIVFLSDELDWPVGDLAIEEDAFGYEPEELGIDPARAPRLESIRELRLLEAGQPWGIFFLEFSRSRLPILQLSLGT